MRGRVFDVRITRSPTPKGGGGSSRAPGGRPGVGEGRGTGATTTGAAYRDDLLLLVILVVIVVDLHDDPDLDLDLVGVVEFDGVSFEHLGDRGLWFVLVGVDGGVGWLLGHSGSYVMDR